MNSSYSLPACPQVLIHGVIAVVTFFIVLFKEDENKNLLIIEHTVSNLIIGWVIWTLCSRKMLPTAWVLLGSPIIVMLVQSGAAQLANLKVNIGASSTNKPDESE